MQKILMLLAICLTACAHQAVKEPGPGLYRAAAVGDIAALSKFSDRELNEPNANGTTLLMVAAKRGNEKSVKYLLSRNVNPNASDLDRQTALHYIGVKDKAAIVDLLRAGADPSTADRFAVTPVIAWAESGAADLVLCALQTGAKWNDATNALSELLKIYENSEAPSGDPDTKTSILKILRTPPLSR